MPRRVPELWLIDSALEFTDVKFLTTSAPRLLKGRSPPRKDLRPQQRVILATLRQKDRLNMDDTQDNNPTMTVESRHHGRGFTISTGLLLMTSDFRENLVTPSRG